MNLENKKVAFLFPGQGSQSVGMGRSFADGGALKYFDEADEALGFPISKMCWDGPPDLLSQTENAQPALLLTGFVAASLLSERGIKPDYVAGHSLGEYTALTFSGAYSLAEGLRLVRRRGKLMSSAVPPGTGKMAALLGLGEEAVLGIVKDAGGIEGRVELANLNCPGQIVVGGHKSAVLRACEIARERGARRTVLLDVSVPSHTSLMNPMKESFERVLSETDVGNIEIPVVTNVNARVVSKTDEIKKSLISQLTNTVRWEESMRNLVSLGVNVFVEVGTGKVLSGLMKKIERNVEIMNIFDAESLDKVCHLFFSHLSSRKVG